MRKLKGTRRFTAKSYANQIRAAFNQSKEVLTSQIDKFVELHPTVKDVRFYIEVAPKLKDERENPLYYSFLIDKPIGYEDFEEIAKEIIENYEMVKEQRPDKVRPLKDYTRIFLGLFEGMEKHFKITEFSVIHLQDKTSTIESLEEEYKTRVNILEARGQNSEEIERLRKEINQDTKEAWLWAMNNIDEGQKLTLNKRGGNKLSDILLGDNGLLGYENIESLGMQGNEFEEQLKGEIYDLKGKDIDFESLILRAEVLGLKSTIHFLGE